MRLLTNLAMSMFVCGGLGTAAMAVPVTFTYTSNAVDISGVETWKYDYLGASTHSAWQTYLPDRHAEISMEVDCSIDFGTVSCAQIPNPVTTFALQSFSRSAPDVAVKLISLSGFTENEVMVRKFRVGPDGKVISWDFTGTEFGMVGDFRLSDGGDQWDYGGDAAGFEYSNICHFAFGVEYDGDTMLCANGKAPPSPSLDLKLGTGKWTAHLADGTPLTDVPLPAGVPLMISAIGALAMLRRRRKPDQAQA